MSLPFSIIDEDEKDSDTIYGGFVSPDDNITTAGVTTSAGDELKEEVILKQDKDSSTSTQSSVVFLGECSDGMNKDDIIFSISFQLLTYIITSIMHNDLYIIL